MNSQLPNSIRNALAREIPSDTHPSADLLNAFVEHALSEGEKRKITDHLARCTECREVVFLSAACEPERASSVIPQAQVQDSHGVWRKRSWRMMWAVPVVTVLLVVSGFLLRAKFASRQVAPELPARVAENSPAPPSLEAPKALANLDQTNVSAPKPARKRPATTGHAEERKSAEAAEIGPNPVPAATVDGMLSALPSAVVNEAPEKVAAPAQTAAATPPHNAFANSDAEHALAKSAVPQHTVITAGAFSRAFAPVHPNWRVTGEGHLEHFAEGSWTRVLADSSLDFRAVSVIGDNIWAGGATGTLFHSSDAGKSWSKSSLKKASGEPETSAIVTIRFDDPEHGMLTTESGSRYSTNDGGVAWASQ